MKAALILAAATLALHAQSQVLPVVDLVYRGPMGTVFDANCNQMLKASINPDAIKAAAERRPELQRLLDRELPAYLTATYAEIGKSYPYKEVQATLTVCPGVQSMSAPLFLNVSRFLPTAPKREEDWYFVEIAYHELMHTYAGVLSQASSLRKKYASEDRVVVNHLHVMALEKFVLLKLGRTSELKHVGEAYQASPSPAYKRGWEIVNQVEDYRAFIKELKAAAGN